MTPSGAPGRVVELGRRNGDSLVVCKFGGTSLAELEHVRGVAERLVAMQQSGRRVVAILSAMGDSTDHLVDLGYQVAPDPPPREFDALLSLGESCHAPWRRSPSMGSGRARPRSRGGRPA